MDARYADFEVIVDALAHDGANARNAASVMEFAVVGVVIDVDIDVGVGE